MDYIFSHHFMTVLASWGDGLPVAAFWLPPISLFCLGYAAWKDARTGQIPDLSVLAGVFIALVADGLYVDWEFAALRLAYALGAAILIATVNQLWFRFFNHDAIGLGDAKWTAIAMMVFSWKVVLVAWFVAAWLGVLWFLVSALLRRGVDSIRFAPYLFIGLCVGLVLLLCPHFLSYVPSMGRFCF